MRKESFTLVEVLVSIFIIGVIASASYLSYLVVNRANEDSENRAMAVNLLQKSLEEVRAAGRSDYDGLNNCSFAVPASCNFDANIADSFPGFIRTLNVVDAESTELKQIDITVTWDERSGQKSLHSRFFLSRPPDPLPGNICGVVTDTETGKGINGVSVRVSYQDNPGKNLNVTTGTGLGCMDDDCAGGGCYSFADGGNYLLDLGNWNLSASKKAYYDYSHPNFIYVTNNRETKVDFAMEPKPDDAWIKGKVVKEEAPESYLYLYVTLNQNGNLKHDANKRYYYYSGASGFKFRISFDEVEEKCFTITTGIRSSEYYYPYRYRKRCGSLCDPYGWGKPYNYRGWSSAMAQDCANPWFGSADSDVVCVSPGDEEDLKIPLAKVPTARLKGKVKDNQEIEIKGATVYANWHYSTNSSYRYGTTTTDDNGDYELTVPAEQELFPDENGYYLRVRACANMPIIGCCNNTSALQWRCSPWQRVGPLLQGNIKNPNFIIGPGSDHKCGNAEGIVKDGKTGAALEGVGVNISMNRNTDGIGRYEFKCNDPDYYRIVQGWYRVKASKNNYYYFQSNGNNYYSNRANIHIVENQTAVYEDIRLWPKGQGIITGKVIDSGSGNPPIEGAIVKLIPYTGGSSSKSTNDDGEFSFDPVLESWPAEGAEGDNYYNQTQRRHRIEISRDGYHSRTIADIELNANQTQDLGDITLTQEGGL